MCDDLNEGSRQSSNVLKGYCHGGFSVFETKLFENNYLVP